MGWEERLQTARYSAPSGETLPFAYEDVSRSITRKTTAFNTPDRNSTYVQDNGYTSRRYPMRVFYCGDECDQNALAFEAILLENGVGILEHPIYGTHNVVPTGEINRRDDLKTAANQVIIDVVFFETDDATFTNDQVDAAAQALEAIEAARAASAATLAADDLNEAVLKGEHQSLLDFAKKGLNKVASATAEVQKEFDLIYNSINNSIDILVGEPLTLAFQTITMLNAPARAAANIQARLDAYRNLASSIVSSGETTATRYRSRQTFSSGYTTGYSLSMLNNDFLSKPQALEAADSLLSLFDELSAWNDDRQRELGILDTGSLYQQLQQAVSYTAGYLVQLSFSLKQEKRFKTQRTYTFIDLCFELYGNTNEGEIDFFINGNNFTGSEILEIPKGREIVWYV